MFLTHLIFLFAVVLCCVGAQGCGKPSVKSNRIIGGNDAKDGAWPWQVLLRLKDQPSCGGSIINAEYVVTAAHCVSNRLTGSPYQPTDLTLSVGEHDIKNRDSHYVSHEVEKVIVHKEFNFRSYRNDVAVLKVNQPIKFTPYVQPICLPDAPVKEDEKECYITGWGRRLRTDSHMHNILQQAKMPVISNQKCGPAMRKVAPIPIRDYNICSGEGNGKTSGCQGDSGGPFACKNGEKWELQGIVSWGSRDCSSGKNQYTVHANVHQLKAWILQNTK